MILILFFLVLLYCSTQTSGVSIQIHPNNTNVILTELNKTVSLTCESDGVAEGDNTLVWLRNNAKINLKEENKKGRSTVCITPVKEDNGATFSCYLHSNDSVKASVTLNVTYHPQLSGSENVTFEIDETLVLQCDMRANPLLLSMSWTLNGTTVDLMAGGLSVTNDGVTSVLRASKVVRKLHEGTYECTATSPVYNSSSKVFNVIVTEKTLKFPLMPLIAGVVVVFVTTLLAVVSRWKKIIKCCK
ncbi:transmembrane and immunoglobulin domain-containing protein 1 isoform X2 [Austrofundulus limnaeus]|nr:PREDICTED: transmembrane and immunoglobulin domain-containing protein 1 isoform X2 [Austrofundulus limnaeus]XP_013858661.1 PREDICTED: transmembrane and immunoglobulin domain-containing protein 1 isoform X2 [Austrofundulus limnaeus]